MKLQYAVVIPTTGKRPVELRRAVESVRNQSLTAAEVFVVVDGGDASTVAESLHKDSAVTILNNSHTEGPAGARNCGVEATRAPWIAFLDDDDEWLVPKIEQQAQLIFEMRLDVCASAARIISGAGSLVLPQRLPAMHEDLAEYFFRHPSVLRPRAYIPTPSIIASRAILEAVPFDEALRQLEDLDWLIRISRTGYRLLSHPAVLLNVHAAARTSPSLSSAATASYLLDWQERVLADSPHLRSNFVVTSVVRAAVREGARARAWGLWWRSARRLKASPGALLDGLFLCVRPHRMPASVDCVLLWLRGGHRSRALN